MTTRQWSVECVTCNAEIGFAGERLKVNFRCKSCEVANILNESLTHIADDNEARLLICRAVTILNDEQGFFVHSIDRT